MLNLGVQNQGEIKVASKSVSTIPGSVQKKEEKKNLKDECSFAAHIVKEERFIRCEQPLVLKHFKEERGEVESANASADANTGFSAGYGTSIRKRANKKKKKRRFWCSRGVDIDRSLT